MINLKKWIDEVRVYQWSKNFIIFLPLILMHDFNLANLIILIQIFFLFSFFVSGTYIINDIYDFKDDANNPMKKKRPIASSKIKIKDAAFVAFFLISLPLAFIYSLFGKEVFFIFIFYFALSLFYSKYLKKIVILDILVLTIFYLIRLEMGAIIFDITISVWLFSFCFFVFLALSSVKRIIELKNYTKTKFRRRNYLKKDIFFLNNISITSSCISSVVILFYTQSENFQKLYSDNILMLPASIIILYWLLRVNYLSNNGIVSHDPVLFALKDKLSYFLFLLILILFILSV